MRTADAARITILLQGAPWLRPLALPLYVVGCLAFFALMGWTGVEHGPLAVHDERDDRDARRGRAG